MPRFSSRMIGLLIGGAMLMPQAAQAQQQGGDRPGWQRGGGERAGNPTRAAGELRGGWQGRGGERGAMINGGARRDASGRSRDAASAIERRAPVAGEAGRRSWTRGDLAGRPDRQPEARRGSEQPDRNERAARRELDRRGGADNRHDNRDRDRVSQRNESRNRDWVGASRNADGHWPGQGREWSERDRDQRNGRWNRDWRNDRRYSWQDHRNRYRGVYRLPRYEARYGHSYRRWSPGYRFDPWIYSSSFWISDPWSYRLPPAYGPYRWVRYFDDVVLVDTASGEIVDIIYDFFF